VYLVRLHVPGARRVELKGTSPTGTSSRCAAPRRTPTSGKRPSTSPPASTTSISAWTGASGPFRRDSSRCPTASAGLPACSTFHQPRRRPMQFDRARAAGAGVLLAFGVLAACDAGPTEPTFSAADIANAFVLLPADGEQVEGGIRTACPAGGAFTFEHSESVEQDGDL